MICCAREHQFILKSFEDLNIKPSDSFKEFEGLCLNPSEKDEIAKKYFIRWGKQNEGWGYYASYVIGAQYIGSENNYPLIVAAKLPNIDFLKMFDKCLVSGINAGRFSKIYEIDFDKPPIQTDAFKSVLSPLIIVHFMSIVEKILKKGLRKGYIGKQQNLKKVKGKISIRENERKNILYERFDRVFCNYQEFSENTPENRLLKKALLFSRNILSRCPASEGLKNIQIKLSRFLSAFDNIGSEIKMQEANLIKTSKLYREYSDAAKLARIILKRYDYSISKTMEEETQTPVFWIDMALLYENYVLGLLKEAYGSSVDYQVDGKTGFPDFVYDEPKIILDAKYIDVESKGVETYIIRQLSGYARDKKIVGDIAEVVPCAVIYPQNSSGSNPFAGKKIEELLSEENSVTGIIEFYAIPVGLPCIK